MNADRSKLHLPKDGTNQTLCGLERIDTQYSENSRSHVWTMAQPDLTKCHFCTGLDMPATEYRRVDFYVPESGACVTVYQHVGKEPLLDIKHFDGNRSLDEAILRATTLTRAWELAMAWHVETRSNQGQLAAP